MFECVCVFDWDIWACWCLNLEIDYDQKNQPRHKQTETQGPIILDCYESNDDVNWLHEVMEGTTIEPENWD